jgi:hypothetical protein
MKQIIACFLIILTSATYGQHRPFIFKGQAISVSFNVDSTLNDTIPVPDVKITICDVNGNFIDGPFFTDTLGNFNVKVYTVGRMLKAEKEGYDTMTSYNISGGPGYNPHSELTWLVHMYKKKK